MTDFNQPVRLPSFFSSLGSCPWVLKAAEASTIHIYFNYLSGLSPRIYQSGQVALKLLSHFAKYKDVPFADKGVSTRNEQEERGAFFLNVH